LPTLPPTDLEWSKAMSDTPEIIYLIPGEDLDGAPAMVWCDDPAPSYADDPDEAVKYVRADIHESALKRQGNAAKMGMDAAKKDACWREENAKRLLSESNPAALESERAANAELTEGIEHLQDALIRQGKMLSAIVNIVKGQPEENSLHSTHDVVESVERLQERVAELECKTCDGHGMIGGPSYSQPDEGGEPCPDCTGMIRPATKAFILRKQAEAVDNFSFHLFVECQDGSHEDSNAHRKAYSEFFVKRLRNEAENTGGTEK